MPTLGRGKWAVSGNQNWSGKTVNSRWLFNNNSDIFPQATYWPLPHPSLFPWHFCCGAKLDCFLDGQKWHGQQNGYWHHHYLDYNVPTWISQWFHAPSKLPKGFRLVFTGVVHTDVLITSGMHDRVCCLHEWKQSTRWPGLLIVFVSLYFLGPVHMYLVLLENGDFLSLTKKKRGHTLCFIILFARPQENPIATENGTHLDGSMGIHWQLSQ